MKKLKLSLSALLLFAVLNSASAQLEQEIRSFVDETEILVNNGRRMMLQAVQARDFERVAEIHQFLNERTQFRCYAFTLSEELAIAILTGNWEYFLQRAEHFSASTGGQLCVQLQDNQLNSALYMHLRADAVWLIDNMLMDEHLTAEEKDLFLLFFHVTQNGADEAYGRKLRDFKRNYPFSRFNDFIDWLPRPHVEFGMGFTFGVTQNFPAGNLSDFFNPSTGGNFGWDFYWDRWTFGLQVDISSFRLSRDLPRSQTGHREDLFEGDRFTYGVGGLLVGYQIFRNNWLRISPYGMIGGGSIESNLYDQNSRNLEFRVFNTFIVGAGLRAEFRFINFSVQDPIMGSVPSGLGIRLDAGTNLPASFNFTPARGHIPYVRASLVWWISN